MRLAINFFHPETMDASHIKKLKKIFIKGKEICFVKG